MEHWKPCKVTITTLLDEDADPDDNEAPFQGFRAAAVPPVEIALTFQKHNPKADELGGKKIMWWEGVGWRVGQIARRNQDARCKVRNQPVTSPSISLSFYEIDEQEAEHALSLNNYHKEGTGDVITSWVLLEEVCE